MANYTTTITNEGAALLASVIANQGTLTFNEFRFSENDYTGQESTLTEGTLLGVFITASAAASVIDSTTIKASAQFNNSTITGNHDLYSIGIIGTDGNTTALIAVCTTTDPDVIREPLTGTSTYAFNVNLTVSDTSQITVAGTTAAVIYDIDVIDHLTSPATNKPLSANQGHLIGDNLAANENVYGAKNQINIPDMVVSTATKTVSVTNNIVHIVNNSAALYNETANLIDFSLPAGTYKINGCGELNKIYATLRNASDNSFITNLTDDDYTLIVNDNTFVYRIQIIIASSYTFSDKYLYPMIRDARILDSTFAPFAETNLQLTQNKAERNDLSTIHATGSTNTTGAQIDAGTFFYLNGSFCKALTNIAVNATFTLNTNFKVDSVGSEIEAIDPLATRTSSASDAPNTFKDGITIEGTYTGTNYPLNYGLVVTLKSTSNRVYQVNFGLGATYIRSNTSATAWGSWYSVTETVVS